MNEQTPKAAFSFKGYKINRFSFVYPEGGKIEYAIGFEPAGEYDKSSGVFTVKLDFKCSFEENKPFVDLNLTASFLFADCPAFEDIPIYFYRNSIAIIFPYIRSFITTLTAVSNIPPMILPLLNLSRFEKELKEKSKVVQDEKSKPE